LDKLKTGIIYNTVFENKNKKDALHLYEGS